MTPAQLQAAGRDITAHLRDLVLSARQVAAYVAVGSEPDTSGLLALRPDALLPVLLPGGDLDWAVAASLQQGPRGLREPDGPRLGTHAVARCDLVLVPALAVDRAGTRLGRGGGSYDRALRRITGRTVALLHDGELVELLPVEPHDVPVWGAASPSGGLTEAKPHFR